MYENIVHLIHTTLEKDFFLNVKGNINVVLHMLCKYVFVWCSNVLYVIILVCLCTCKFIGLAAMLGSHRDLGINNKIFK